MVSNNTRKGYVFPLFLYPAVDKRDLFTISNFRNPGRTSNQVSEMLGEVYSREMTPKISLHLRRCAPTYRELYVNFLKRFSTLAIHNR
jgi:hypothetical protein